jgi:AcrR family transcriptional regulator
VSEPRKRRSDPADDQGPFVSLLPDDPIAALPPTAQRILAAARRLLVRDGFKALSLSAIAAEAGEAKGSIRYHFGNKDGLVTALVDSLAHDANRALITECAALPPGAARVHALLDGELRIVADAESFRAFFEVLPYALRVPALRQRVAALYDGYRETVRRCLDDAAGGAPELRRMAVLMIAIVDGLAIQHGLDPEQADLSGALALWEGLVRGHVDRAAAAT